MHERNMPRSLKPLSIADNIEIKRDPQTRVAHVNMPSDEPFTAADAARIKRAMEARRRRQRAG